MSCEKLPHSGLRSKAQPWKGTKRRPHFPELLCLLKGTGRPRVNRLVPNKPEDIAIALAANGELPDRIYQGALVRRLCAMAQLIPFREELAHLEIVEVPTPVPVNLSWMLPEFSSAAGKSRCKMFFASPALPTTCLLQSKNTIARPMLPSTDDQEKL